MKLILFSILLFIHLPFSGFGQFDETLEVQIERVDSNSNVELQIFQKRFNLWIESIKKKTTSIELDKKLMIDNFIIFSEDGLIMKDISDFHTVTSCKKEILRALPDNTQNFGNNNWIYVSLESHVNKIELIEILEFFKQKKIDYYFGIEDEFVPLIREK